MKGSLRACVVMMSLSVCYLGLIAPARAATLDGLWASEGFRRGLIVERNRVRAFDISAVGGVPKWDVTGTLDPATGAISFLENGCQRRLVLDAASDTAHLSADCCVTEFIWRRMTERPRIYDQKLEDTPQMNYAVFWQTFKENYPFFDQHHVDWDSVDRTYRPQVTDRTTPKELFDIFWNMTAPLEDAHVYLRATYFPELQAETWGRRPDANRIRLAEMNRLNGIIKGRCVPNIKEICQNRIRYGTTRDDIGYLRVDAFGAYVSGGVFAENKKALDEALDTILADTQKWKGLIIDVRENSGGWAGMDVWLATRFTAEKYLAYTTETRDNLDGPLHFTPKQQVWVNPTTRPNYLGKVVVLQGRDSVSSAENFVLAMMGRKPAVTRIGENTQGVFSEVLERKLPNGWGFGLPNQIYRTADGRSFDIAGVPPDIAVPVFPPDELKDGRDSAMAKAMEVIMNPRSGSD